MVRHAAMSRQDCFIVSRQNHRLALTLSPHLLGGDGNIALLDPAGHLAGRNALDHASHGGAGAEHLEQRTLELAGHGLGAVLAGNIDNLVQGEAPVMLD